MPKERGHGEGALYKLKGRDLWRGVVTLEPDPVTGRRRQKFVHARTQRACKTKLDKLKDEIREFGEPLDTSTKTTEWATAWLDAYARPHVDPSTFTAYKGFVKNWVIPTIGNKRVSALKGSDITAVHRAIIDGGRSTGTAKAVHHMLSKMLEQARREQMCRRNVTKDVDAPKYTPASKAALEVEDVLKLLAAATRRKNGSLMWFRILGGQRQGEILGAVIEDLNLDTGYYTVNWKLEHLTSRHGCGERVDGKWPCGKKQGASCTDRRFLIPDNFRSRKLYGGWHLTEPKSKTGKRVPLIEQLADIIRRDLLFMQDKPNPHGLIWRHDDGSPILPGEDQDAWRELLHECGLIAADQLRANGTPLTGHIARHTAVTTLAALGADMQLIGEIVGHSSEDVTRMYRHAGDAEKMAAMVKLGDRLLGELTS